MLAIVALGLASAFVTAPVAGAIITDPTTGSGGSGSGGSGSGSSSETCTLFAGQPIVSGDIVYGYGGREGCTTVRTVTVLLRQDISFWPDRTLDIDSDTDDNLTLTVAESCAGHKGGMRVFIETRTNTGGKFQSPRTSWWCP
jgi:hypothetical protein